MACARPLDDEPDRFLDLLAELLWDDGWLETLGTARLDARATTH